MQNLWKFLREHSTYPTETRIKINLSTTHNPFESITQLITLPPQACRDNPRSIPFLRRWLVAQQSAELSWAAFVALSPQQWMKELIKALLNGIKREMINFEQSALGALYYERKFSSPLRFTFPPKICGKTARSEMTNSKQNFINGFTRQIKIVRGKFRIKLAFEGRAGGGEASS